jgi:transposase InsO family protein
MATERLSIQVACRVLSVSESGYYAWRKRPPSVRAVRHAWLTDRLRAVHAASRGTYGARRVHAELVLGQGIPIGHPAVERLMRAAGIQGLADRPRYRKSAPHAAATDRVGRQFVREAPDQLWVTDITEHPTREGKVYCAVVLDVFSRRVVGWSIDAAATAALVTNALSMALDTRRPTGPTVIHSDQGTQYGSWAFTRRAQDAGLLPSMGAVGTCFDNALMESFWSRVQVELLDRQAWHTRVQLATALFEYLEIFHNRQRRHSSIGMLTPMEFETQYRSTTTSTVA